MSYPKIDRSRAHSFWLQITRYQPHKLAGKSTGISEHTAKKYRYGDLPGPTKIEYWKRRWGKPFEDFINGEQDNVKIAALEARLAEIKKELDAERGA